MMSAAAAVKTPPLIRRRTSIRPDGERRLARCLCFAPLIFSAGKAEVLVVGQGVGGLVMRMHFSLAGKRGKHLRVYGWFLVGPAGFHTKSLVHYLS